MALGIAQGGCCCAGRGGCICYPQNRLHEAQRLLLERLLLLHSCYLERLLLLSRALHSCYLRCLQAHKRILLRLDTLR